MPTDKIISGNLISDDDPLQSEDSAVAPADDLIPVTKSDETADPNGPFRGLLIGVAGIVKLTTLGGRTITLPSGALATGVIHPIRFTRIWNGTTTATDVYGIV